MRKKLSHTPGITLFMVAVQDLRAGGRSGKGSYQYTLWDADLDELLAWQSKVIDRLRKVPGLVDVSTDREQGSLEAKVVIDRAKASALGVGIQAVDDALNDAFGERQVSTIYTQRNQYRVVLEVATRDQRDPADLTRIYVPGTGGTQVPLSAFTHIERGTSALVVNHQGAFPSVTITYNLRTERQPRHDQPSDHAGRGRHAPSRRLACRVHRRRAGLPAGRRQPGDPHRGGARPPSTSSSACSTRVSSTP